MCNALMRIAVVAGAAALVPTAAGAAPAPGANPAGGSSAVQPVQEFGFYVGPRYRYYSDPYWDYGYGYRPSYYYYGPSYSYGPRYYGYRSDRRYFRGLERRAP